LICWFILLKLSYDICSKTWHLILRVCGTKSRFNFNQSWLAS
jgi:hypothetical protein